jgi:hypothetical protein
MPNTLLVRNDSLERIQEQSTGSKGGGSPLSTVRAGSTRRAQPDRQRRADDGPDPTGGGERAVRDGPDLASGGERAAGPTRPTEESGRHTVGPTPPGADDVQWDRLGRHWDDGRRRAG